MPDFPCLESPHHQAFRRASWSKPIRSPRPGVHLLLPLLLAAITSLQVPWRGGVLLGGWWGAVLISPRKKKKRESQAGGAVAGGGVRIPWFVRACWIVGRYRAVSAAMFNSYGGFGARAPSVFLETYKCHSMTMHDKEDKEGGDKIILPMSAFERLAQMHITYPMQFEVKNESMMDLTGEGAERVLRTHVGVLEFTAQEGKCYVPYWIMQNLLLGEGSFIQVRNVTLPLAQFIKFRPQSEDFLEISNPKAVLESTLRNFSCVTKSDTICIPYNQRKYFLDVVDVKPADACSIVEADVKVDFEPPPGYQEKLDAAKAAAEAAAQAAAPAKTPASAPSPGKALGSGDDQANGGESSKNGFSMAELAKAREARKAQLEAKKNGFVAFSGHGRRIDGKAKREQVNPSQQEAFENVAVPVATVRKSKFKKSQGAAFAGEGKTLQ